MAKKRKSYSKFKRMMGLSDHLMRNILICYHTELGGCHFYDRVKKHLVKPTELLVACAEMPHNWVVYLGVTGKTMIDEYHKGEAIVTKSRYKQSDLAPVLEEYHLELIKSVPDHHRTGVFWIGSPTGYECSEKEAAEIMEGLLG